MEIKETAVNYVAGDENLTVYTAEKKYINLVRRLLADHPNEVMIVKENQDGSLLVRMPLSWFRFPKPKREMSEQQRSAASDRMKKMWRRNE